MHIGCQTVRIARTPQEVETYRRFFAETSLHPDADIDCFLHEIRNSCGMARPHLIAVCESDEPLAILVGKVSDTALSWRIGYKKVGASMVKLLEVVYRGVLGELTYESAITVCDSILKSLADGEADLALISYIKKDSTLHQAAISRPSILCRDHFVNSYPHHRLLLPNGYEEFYRQRSDNTKSNIRQYKNRIKKKFGEGLTVRCFKDESDIDRTAMDIESIADKTYQRKLDVGFFHSPHIREKWLLAARNRWFLAYLLYLDDEPRAYWTGYLYKGVFTSEYTGFDPQYSYYHPGMFILLRMIEDFCGRGDVAAVDFGPGDADYKSRFGTECWQETTVHIFAPTFRGVRLGLIRDATITVSECARNILGTLGVAERLKTRWRKHLAPG